MRPFGKISSSIMRSKKFRKVQDDRAQLIYLMLHISESGNSIGCFHMPPDKLAIELRKPIEGIEDAYQRLQSVGLIRYDDEEELVQIVGFIAHTPPSSFKHLSGINTVFNATPSCPLKDALAHEIADALEEKAEGWSDEIDSKSVFLQRASDLRKKHPMDTPIYTPMDRPIHTPINQAENDTPMDRGMDTPMDTQDIDKTKTESETETETKTGGGHKGDGPELTFRERIMQAAGMEEMTASGRLNGYGTDMVEADRWINDLGLTEDEVIDVIRETVNRKTDGPPEAFKYFNKPMQRFAGLKAQGALQPDMTAKPSQGMRYREDANDRINQLAQSGATLRPPSMGDGSG